jgi:hypothetical protein
MKAKVIGLRLNQHFQEMILDFFYAFAKGMCIPKLVVLISGFLLWQGAHATVLQVCPTGCPYTSIQHAVNAVDHPGRATILISGGVFHETVTITDKSLTLKGAGSTQTIIDGSGNPNNRVVTLRCSSPHTVYIDGVTITGGNLGGDIGDGNPLTNGAGLSNEGCDVRIQGSAVVDNDVGVECGSDSCGEGGGIFNSKDGNMVLKDTQVADNQAAALGGGGIYNAGSLRLEHSLVANNEAGADFSSGGGIYNTGTLTVKGSLITHNFAGGLTTGGGGIYNDGEAFVVDSSITHNTDQSALPDVGGQGGGIFNTHAGSLSLSGSFISRNITTNATITVTPLGEGAGLFNDGGTVSAKKTLIINNTPNNCAGVAFACP